MADATEDVARAPAGDSDSEAGDSDTAPDYGAFLTSLSSSAALAPTSSTLPKRGIKDFEPHRTEKQSSALQKSRDAMSAALSHTRVHAPKSHVRATYNETTGLTRIKKVKGQALNRVGRDISGGGLDLQPEEALWALERGALDIFWPRPTSTSLEPVEEGEEGVGLPMSLQAAYAAYIGGEWGLTPEKYVVYAGLKRAGFVVFRAHGFHEVRRQRRTRGTNEPTKNETSMWDWLRGLIFDESSSARSQRLAVGPLVRPGLYRSFDDIFAMLRIIPVKEPIKSVPETTTSEPGKGWSRPHDLEAARDDPDKDHFEEVRTPFTTTYNIYRPLPNFRKTAPGEPAFRVCVVSARETRMPTLRELEALLEEQAADPPPSHLQPPSSSSSGVSRGNGNGGRGAGVGGVYGRLKHGQRNVLLAVVDEGVVSYMRVSEAAFASERLYERVGSGGGRGGKRGQRGRRERGRGRGRGS